MAKRVSKKKKTTTTATPRKKAAVKKKAAATAKKKSPARKTVAKKAAAKKPAVKKAGGKKTGGARYNGIGDEAVKTKTGKTWGEWIASLDALGAAKMAHKEIARLVNEKFKVGDWWSQMVTVGYEQAKGLRAVHQKADGFAVNVSRVIAVPVEKVFEAWHDARERLSWLGETAHEIRKATANKSIRITWTDTKPPSNVDVNFYDKGKGKSQVQIEHAKLSGAEAVKMMKNFWAERVEKLRERLGGGEG